MQILSSACLLTLLESLFLQFPYQSLNTPVPIFQLPHLPIPWEYLLHFSLFFSSVLFGLVPFVVLLFYVPGSAFCNPQKCEDQEL